MMIAALLAASLVQSAAHPPQPISAKAAPCQAVPTLCMSGRPTSSRLPLEGSTRRADNKMSAYRFDARPCRIIGNMGCPKQARLRVFKLGEPLRETLMRSFASR
ncbi:hypothetical protein [Sphingobium chungangianum]